MVTCGALAGARGVFPLPVPLLLLACLSLWAALSQPASASNCVGCLNGGKQLMPNNIFGYCRCKCRGGYVGPKCQFSKRSSPPNMDRPAVQALEDYKLPLEQWVDLYHAAGAPVPLDQLWQRLNQDRSTREVREAAAPDHPDDAALSQ